MIMSKITDIGPNLRKTCRIYINQGMADLGQHTLPTWGVNRIHTFVKNFNQVFTTVVDTGLPL